MEAKSKHVEEILSRLQAVEKRLAKYEELLHDLLEGRYIITQTSEDSRASPYTLSAGDSRICYEHGGWRWTKGGLPTEGYIYK